MKTESWVELTGVILGVVIAAILGPLIAALLGALGLVVASWVFSALAAKVVVLTGLEIYQIGAILGVLSTFFKGSVTQKVS